MLRRSDNEKVYGVQIATNQISEGVRAGEAAAEAGADFLDLNVGCPIYEATRRGLGAALLRKPPKLARLVGGGSAAARAEGSACSSMHATGTAGCQPAAHARQLSCGLPPLSCRSMASPPRCRSR